MFFRLRDVCTCMTGSWGFSIWKIVITFRIHRHRAWTMAIFLKWEKNCNEYSRELCSLKILYSWSVLYCRYLINLNITQSSSNFIGEFAKYCNVIGLTCDQLLHFLETWRPRPLPRCLTGTDWKPINISSHRSSSLLQ